MNRRPTFLKLTFATSCWEKDWRQILLDPDYLRVRQIGNHLFPFSERLLIINNVENREEVRRAAEAKVDSGVLTRFVFAEEEILPFFQLKRSDFTSDWQYYNALAPLAAIHACSEPYLLYVTGDVRLDEPVRWIEDAVGKMEKNFSYKVANLVWNRNGEEAKRESARRDGEFWVAQQGFSDQMFLVRRGDFRQPIYGEIREDGSHYPRGDVFEKRVFSYMKNRGWLRITYSGGSYIHENF